MAGRKPAPIEHKVTAMLSAGIKQKVIAQALHVSERTIQRYALKSRPEIEQSDKLLSDLQVHVQRQLPTEKTVKALAQSLAVALSTKQPSAALSVIQYRDKLMGIVTPLDRLKVEATRNGVNIGLGDTRPIFMLESGASINVTVGHQPSSELPSPVDRQEIIDVEPSDPPAPLESPRTGDDT